MTREEAYAIAQRFIGHVLRADTRQIRLTAKYVGDGPVTVVADYGPRKFEIHMDRGRNLIKLSEVTTRRKLGFDHRVPGGFGMKEVCDRRVIRAERLDVFEAVGEGEK